LFINVLKYFSSLRYFKAKNYPFDEFLHICNSFLKNYTYNLYFWYFFAYCKGLIFFLKDLKKNKFLKRIYYDLMLTFKRLEKNYNHIKILYLKNFKLFLKLKYKMIKIRKVIFLVEPKEPIEKLNRKKTKEELLLDKKIAFSKIVLKFLNKLKVKRHSIRYKVKKVTKKIYKYLKKKKKNTFPYVLKKLSYFLTYRKEKKRKGQKKKAVKFFSRYNNKGTFKERKAADLKLYKSLYKNEKKIR
jgi:hypothetical protein